MLLFVQAIIMASKEPKISQQDTAGKKRHVTLTFHRNF